MKTIKEIYEWSKITHENIKDFYEDVKKNDNYVENFFNSFHLFFSM